MARDLVKPMYENAASGVKSPARTADASPFETQLDEDLNERPDTNQLDDSWLSPQERVRFTARAIGRHLDIELDTTDAAALRLLLGVSVHFSRPSPYRVASAYDVDQAEMWNRYRDFTHAYDPRSLRLVGFDGIEYETAARRRVGDTSEVNDDE